MQLKTKVNLENSDVNYPIKDRVSLLWLLLGFITLLFANGLQIIPAAAWIASVFLLRFIRTRKVFIGLFIGYIANMVAFYFQWNAAFKDAGPMFTLYTTVFGLLVYLPYVADRLLIPYIRGFAATMIFPSAWVVMEYLLHIFLPLGTFFNISYTQNMNLPLLQIMSVTGLWGVSFMITWFASVSNYIWESGFDIKRTGSGAMIYIIILAAVLFYGGLRLVYFKPVGPTVQVSVLTTNINKEPLPDAETPEYQRLVTGTLTDGERQEISLAMTEINNDLLERTRIQARSGSKIVTWCEFNAQAFSDGEKAFLNQACKLASDEKIYLAFPFEITEPDMSKRLKSDIFQVNKSVMITPEGKIAYQYVKHNLLIGPESANTLRGPRQITAIDTPYGKLSSTICLDMEYPDFMRLAGKQGVDIMLCGAIDGTPSTKGNPLHSIMASYRTIEEGFSLGRAGYYGQNVAVDYQGRLLGAANHYTAGDRTVVAHLPVKGTKTLYSILGDFFPWSSILILLILIGTALYNRRHILKRAKK